MLVLHGAGIPALPWTREERRGIVKSRRARATVGTWLDEWLRVYVVPRARDGELAQSTVGSYQGIVRRYLKPSLGAVELRRLTPEHITGLYLEMGTPKAEGGYGVSVRTRELAHAVLSSALGKAVEIGRLSVNVVEKGRGVDRPRTRRHVVAALDENDALHLLAMLAVADGHAARLYLPALLGLTTGMRRGELLALRWNEVMLPPASQPDAFGLITVSRAWDAAPVVGGGRAPIDRYRVRPWPKSGKTRYIDIAPEVVAVLREARAAHDERRTAAGASWTTAARRTDGSSLVWGELVISDTHGLPWWPDSFSSAWRTWRDSMSLTCRFHDLRATSGSLALAAGIDPEVVRQRLGHHSAAFFLERYAKAMHTAQKRDAGIMGKFASRTPVPMPEPGTRHEGHEGGAGP